MTTPLETLVSHGWDVDADGTRLRKTFVFGNFVEAFGFMTKVALKAEAMDHHPEWKNIYKTVWVELTTHDAGDLTDRDFDLAKIMDSYA